MLFLMDFEVPSVAISATCVLCFCLHDSWFCWIYSAWNFFNTFREDHEMLHSLDLQKLELVLSPTHLEVGFYLKYDIFYMFLETVR